MMLEPLDVGVLFAAALATSVLSAIVGMAGGITLLTVMLLYMDPLVAIPVHGVVQLVSNGTRAVVQRRHVEPGIALRYGILLLPMGFAGLWLARQLPPDATRLVIGVFVLLATWAPRWLLLGSHPDRIDRNRRFFLLGGVVGFLNVTLGATGPLIAPFFLNLGLTRQALVGTKAACQLLGHLAKIVIFGVVGFAYAEWVIPLALLCLAVVVGTWAGSRMLERVSEKAFVRLYKTVLTLIALRLVASVGVGL
ncbi:MAG: sulfite exporter TauE/SafE family protein [Myxococcales bacterium]|nr:sulfite exporter TauE/SafE family protein [Myxococcales bacterium]